MDMNPVKTGPSWGPPENEGSPALLCCGLATSLLYQPRCCFLLLGLDTADAAVVLFIYLFETGFFHSTCHINVFLFMFMIINLCVSYILKCKQLSLTLVREDKEVILILFSGG